MNGRRDSLRVLSAAGLAAASTPLFAQDDRTPVTVLVGAASSMDLGARLIADQLRASLGRPAIAMSRLGAGQRIALMDCKNAAPDGRTLIYVTSGPFAIYPHVYTRLDYEPEKDFTPIVGIAQFDVAIATGPMTGAKTLPELIDWMRREKDGTMFGSAPGNGSFSHFVGTALSLATGLKMIHVPYKDSGVGMVDLASGRIPMMISGFSAVLPMHRSGKTRILALSGAKRSALAPDIPTLQESGVDVARSTTTGVFGPAGMSPQLVRQLHDAIRPMTADPEVVGKMREQSVTMWPASGPELMREFRAERDYFGDVAKRSGFVPEVG